MERKFDRIVDFAELWDFIDAPVRTYSSGMYARLGFAIATDVNPDILLIDEVLAVGDEAFQKKSEARLQEFRNQRTTILLVSHSMDAIERMCQRAAWIDQAELKAVGSSKDVIQAYREHF
jgi:ABC-type polysaccharide/polyol phosphate transport system ATPase subunit